MKKKQIISVLMAGVLSACILSACKDGKTSTDVKSSLPSKINEEAAAVSDTADMPDWKGDKKKLVYWYCQGTTAATIGKSTKDKTIQNELERISGITWDEEASFDNNGNNGDTRIAKIVATNTWPDVACNLDLNLVKRFTESDKIWDLTEYIPKYMPNFMKIVNYNENSKKAYENTAIDGKHYYFPKPTDYATARVLDKDYSPEKYAAITEPEDSRGWVWVRDDILKKLYPEAKTLEEIEDIYMKNGSFTKEDMTDVVIHSKDEFKKLLQDIDALNIKENGRKVYPFYTHDGSDNWGILTIFNFMCGTGPSSNVNYFAYFDRELNKIVRTADQKWFKDEVRFLVSLVNEGLASGEALLDNRASFEQKKNNGEYAVLMPHNAPPTKEALKAAGKTYNYRKVLVDIPMDYSKFIKKNSSEVYYNFRYTLFKTDNIKTEKDVEQVLRYLDSFLTESVTKTVFWGPENSGLYTETNGIKKYNDELLESDLVNKGLNSKDSDYGINAFPSLLDFAYNGFNNSPKVVYSQSGERNPADYLNVWNYSFVEPVPAYPELKTDWAVWNWTTTIDEIKKYWDARQLSEDAFKVLFTTKNDGEFEKYYADLISVLDRNGLSEKTMEDWNNKFKEENKEYWDGFINWKPEN